MDINDKNCFRQEIDAILLTLPLIIVNTFRFSGVKEDISC